MRVAVTTARDSADLQAVALREAGLIPVILPCIEVQGGDDPAAVRRAVDDAEMLVITSARTVRILWPGGGMPQVPVAAVGPSTAKAVKAAGGRVSFVGTGGASELVSLIADRVRNIHVVFPQARDADPATAVRLRNVGATVETPVAYRTVPVSPGPDPVEAALFGSPSAVAGWTSARTLDGILAVAMGTTTAGALVEGGAADIRVASRPGLSGLVDEVHAALNQRSNS